MEVGPSKEWIVPPRPKPGRKAAPNKASSQKAFRERKAERLLELEEQVKRYELEDGNKAAVFQQQALALQAENTQLKMLVAKQHREICDLKQSMASAPEEEPPAKRAKVSVQTEAPQSHLLLPEPDLPSMSADGTRISCGQCSSAADCLCNDASLALRPRPSYAVPLSRRIRSDSRPHKPVWQIRRQAEEEPKQAGPASSLSLQFSQALESSVCRNSPCSTCPYRDACRQDENVAVPKAAPAAIEGAITSQEVWRELSEHPKIGAANLTMLADVVSHHTKCEGRTSLAADGSGQWMRNLAIEKQAVLDARAMLDKMGD